MREARQGNGGVRDSQEGDPRRRPWTPENDMVTAAFKLKRANIYKAFKGAIDGLYKK